MTADADKIRSIFLAAVESYPPEQWQAYLDEACASDDDSRKRVEALCAGTRRTTTCSIGRRRSWRAASRKASAA